MYYQVTDHVIPFNEVIIIEEMASGDSSNPCLFSESKPEIQISNSLVDLSDNVDTAVKPGNKPQQNVYSFPSYNSVQDVRCDIIVRSRKHSEAPKQHSKKLNNFKLKKGYFSLYDIMKPVPQKRRFYNYFDMEFLKRFITCELCKNIMVNSEKFHVCSQGHMGCGDCYKNGYYTCAVCKRALRSNNLTKSFLLKLYYLLPQSAHNIIKRGMLPEDMEPAVKYYSYRVVTCPEVDCYLNLGFNYFLSHFFYDHKTAPVLEVKPYNCHSFVLSKNSVDLSRQTVLAVFKLNIPDGKQKVGLFQNFIPCCLFGATVEINGFIFYIFWVSCFFEEQRLPPVNFRVRATTSNGWRSFSGGLRSLHDSQDPSSVLDYGRCLVLLPKDVEVDNLEDDNNFVTLKIEFYLK